MLPNCDIQNLDDLYDTCDKCKEIAQFMPDLPAHVMVASNLKLGDANAIADTINYHFHDREDVWAEVVPGVFFTHAVLVRARLTADEYEQAKREAQKKASEKFDIFFKQIDNLSILRPDDIPKLESPYERLMNELKKKLGEKDS